MRRPRPLLLALALALAACGGGPAVLDRVDGLADDDRERLTRFAVVLDAAHIAGLVPDDAPQRIEVQPRSLVESGLARYLPIVAAELAEALRDFEEESGVPALEAFDRLIFWSEAPTVDRMSRSRAELIFAFDGGTLVELIEWMERSPSTADEARDADEDDGHHGAMFVAAFSALTPAQLAKVRAVMDDDPQRVASFALGPETRLVTARGGEGPEAWTMWGFSWPGGFLAERGGGGDLTDPPTAIRRLAQHLRRVERAAREAPSRPPPDRVLSARVRGPEPVALDLDMGEQVGLRVSAPASLFALQMPPSVLVAAWPMMKPALIGGLGRGLREAGVGSGFEPLVAGAIRASELALEGGRLTLSTALPRQAFEALLPTL